jgi:hypothetical protein
MQVYIDTTSYSMALIEAEPWHDRPEPLGVQGNATDLILV